MASFCFRKLDFLPATLKQSSCIMVPFRMDNQSFHSSRRCLEEMQKKAQTGEQTYRHVEYNAPRRFKIGPNPVAIAWVIGLPSAFALFFLAKRQVENKRVKQMKARRQMMAASKEDSLTQRTGKHLDTKTS
ncbi:PREDICTED: probable hydrolase PNKD [Thamnophis sirtalis]|uniref:Probable hydrolase PNKD n=1 Tax=Thamnophis sirtalis TaxID=35019 RepID=A0A6I9YE02_9SAUR|nr:PREDICTED: probable hydrolase PNKD [Thamnophis sirtalis]